MLEMSPEATFYLYLTHLRTSSKHCLFPFGTSSSLPGTSFRGMCFSFQVFGHFLVIFG